MATNDYHFLTRWRVSGTCQEVSDVIGDATSLPRWWPSVYLDVHELERGDAAGVGRIIDLSTKGWLPYTLQWSFRVVDSFAPHGFHIEAWGDFVGEGRWTFAEDGGEVDIEYDWRIIAEKPLLRRLSPLLKPLFAANHRWAMARGEESLRLELARRRAVSPQDLAAIPVPPGRTSLRKPAVAAAAAVAAVAAVAGLRRITAARP